MASEATVISSEGETNAHLIRNVVIDWGSKVYHLQADLSEPVGALMQVLERKTGIAVARQQLILKRKRLKANDCWPTGLKDGDHLTMIVSAEPIHINRSSRRREIAVISDASDESPQAMSQSGTSDEYSRGENWTTSDGEGEDFQDEEDNTDEPYITFMGVYNHIGRLMDWHNRIRERATTHGESSGTDEVVEIEHGEISVEEEEEESVIEELPPPRQPDRIEKNALDDEELAERIAEQERAREMLAKDIKETMSDPKQLREILMELPGVNPDDPRFQQFYNTG